MDTVNIMAVLPYHVSKFSNSKADYHEGCFFSFGQHKLSICWLVIYLFLCICQFLVRNCKDYIEGPFI